MNHARLHFSALLQQVVKIQIFNTHPHHNCVIIKKLPWLKFVKPKSKVNAFPIFAA